MHFFLLRKTEWNNFLLFLSFSKLLMRHNACYIIITVTMTLGKQGFKYTCCTKDFMKILILMFEENKRIPLLLRKKPWKQTNKRTQCTDTYPSLRLGRMTCLQHEVATRKRRVIKEGEKNQKLEPLKRLWYEEHIVQEMWPQISDLRAERKWN